MQLHLERSSVFLWQELSRVKAAALTERGQAEEELIKVRNQARLEEVRARPGPGPCLCGKEWIWLPMLLSQGTAASLLLILGFTGLQIV